MEEITKAQEEVLQALWKAGEGAVSDVVNQMAEPKPAYTTVATVIKVLEKKGYVSHKVFGKTYVFYPTVTEKEYTQFVLKDSFKKYFNNSLNQVVSFFARQKEKVSLSELEELKQFVEEEIRKQKKNN